MADFVVKFLWQVRTEFAEMISNQRNLCQPTIDINAENAYGKAVGRVVLEDWSAEDAVDELIERIKQIAGS